MLSARSRHTAQFPKPAVRSKCYDFAESLADHYLLMERGEFVTRGEGKGMAAQGVKEALVVLAAGVASGLLEPRVRLTYCAPPGCR